MLKYYKKQANSSKKEPNSVTSTCTDNTPKVNKSNSSKITTQSTARTPTNNSSTLLWISLKTQLAKNSSSNAIKAKNHNSSKWEPKMWATSATNQTTKPSTYPDTKMTASKKLWYPSPTKNSITSTLSLFKCSPKEGGNSFARKLTS